MSLTPRRYAQGGFVRPPEEPEPIGRITPEQAAQLRQAAEAGAVSLDPADPVSGQVVTVRVNPEQVERITAQFAELREAIASMVNRAVPAMAAMSDYMHRVQESEDEALRRRYPGAPPDMTGAQMREALGYPPADEEFMTPRLEYDELIADTQRHLPDPHDYRMPETNAMHWTPPAEGEEVPSWLA